MWCIKSQNSTFSSKTIQLDIKTHQPITNDITVIQRISSYPLNEFRMSRKQHCKRFLLMSHWGLQFNLNWTRARKHGCRVCVCTGAQFCSVRTMAAACPMVPAGSTLAPAVVLTLLGCRMRTAGPATMAGGVPPAAGLTPCCRGWVRDCWLFSKDSLRAGRLFCWRTQGGHEDCSHAETQSSLYNCNNKFTSWVYWLFYCYLLNYD